jgi:hypothetical protein
VIRCKKCGEGYASGRYSEHRLTPRHQSAVSPQSIRQHARYASDPEFRARSQNGARERYHTNPERQNEAGRAGYRDRQLRTERAHQADGRPIGPRAAQRRGRYEQNQVRIRAEAAAYQRAHPASAETNRRRHLRKAFGLTPEDYDAILAAQGGVCAVCRRPETSRNRTGAVRRLAVDHDHATGRIRGLTCLACNRTIGYARDDPTVLDAAATYLRAALHT